MEEPRAWPVLDLPGSCRAELASPAPKAGPRRSLSHPARLVYGRCSGQGCCPEAKTRTGWVLNGRAFVADQADFEGVNGCGGVRVRCDRAIHRKQAAYKPRLITMGPPLCLCCAAVGGCVSRWQSFDQL